MSTTVTRVMFGASMWVPRPDPARAIMPIGPCTHPQGESECPVCRWLSVPHSQDNDPKEPPKREEDTLTKHNLGGFPRTRGDGPRRATIVIDNSS